MRYAQVLAMLCLLVGVNACSVSHLSDQKKEDLRTKAAEKFHLSSDASWKDIQRAAKEKYLGK